MENQTKNNTKALMSTAVGGNLKKDVKKQLVTRNDNSSA